MVIPIFIVPLLKMSVFLALLESNVKPCALTAFFYAAAVFL